MNNTQTYGEGANRKETAIFTLGMACLLFVAGAALGGMYVYGGMLATVGS